MRRRDFIKVFAGSALAWPLGARAQTERPRLIAVLMGYAESDQAIQSEVSVLRAGLAKLGWTEGVNLRIEVRWGWGDDARIRKLAKELVDMRPDVILGQTTPVTAALARETQTIPIVFVNVNDPVASGFVRNSAHPGGNVTGFSVASSEQGGKWVELLKEISPNTLRMALLFNPATGVPLQNFMPSIQTAASSFGVDVRVAPVDSRDEIESLVAAQAKDAGSGLIVLPSAFNTTNREPIVALTARHRVPTIYYNRFYTESGGLISYGPDYAEHFRQAPDYVNRILKGAKPADLPVQAPTKYELVINLKTAKALGVNVPPSMQARADEMID